MTILQGILAACGAAILMVCTGLLVYTVIALLSGRRTVSGYLASAPRWLVALVTLITGLVIGSMFAHWWWPTVGY